MTCDCPGVTGVNPHVAGRVVAAPDGGPVLAAAGGFVDHPLGHKKLSAAAPFPSPGPTGDLSRRVDDAWGTPGGRLGDVGGARINGEATKGDTGVLDDAVPLPCPFRPRCGRRRRTFMPRTFCVPTHKVS